MKKLIVSIKPTSVALNEIANRLKAAQKTKQNRNAHYEISFTDTKQFKRFISNIDLLTSIQHLKPNSIYELAQLTGKDVGNLNRTINFFAKLGALKLEKKEINGRSVRQPSIPYQKIEFDLIA